MHKHTLSVILFSLLILPYAGAADACNHQQAHASSAPLLQEHHAINLALHTYAAEHLSHLPPLVINLGNKAQYIKALIINTQQIYTPLERKTAAELLHKHGTTLEVAEELLFFNGITIIQKKSAPTAEIIQEAMKHIEGQIQTCEMTEQIIEPVILKQQMIDEIITYKDFFLDQNRHGK